jgi:hypothetical protein
MSFDPSAANVSAGTAAAVESSLEIRRNRPRNGYTAGAKTNAVIAKAGRPLPTGDQVAAPVAL